MNQEFYQQLSADLGYEFHLFTMEHPDWAVLHIPAGAIIVMQTDDPGFNTWARQIAEQNRAVENPPRPLVLVHIRELLPLRSRIVQAEAEIVLSGSSA
jgi:uncharacterized protein DUF5647